MVLSARSWQDARHETGRHLAAPSEQPWPTGVGHLRPSHTRHGSVPHCPILTPRGHVSCATPTPETSAS